MAVPLLEPHCEGQTDRHPLLMERRDNHNDCEHIIDIVRGGNASSSGSSRSDPSPVLDLSRYEDRPSNSTHAPMSHSSSFSSNGSNSGNSSFIRRSDRYDRRHRSPLNSVLWISIELVVTISQIIASIIVLSLSRHEKPQAPLYEWVVGYAAGCVATLPLLYWRYRHRDNQGIEQDSMQPRRSSSQINIPSEPTSYTAVSVTQVSEEEHRQASVTGTWNRQNAGTPNARYIGAVCFAYVSYYPQSYLVHMSPQLIQAGSI